MKYLLDENLSPQLAVELRAQGLDACAVTEVGLSGAPDERILHFAVEASRVIITLDADFANVVRFPPEQTPGIVRLTEAKIRQTIRRALLLLCNIDLTGRLAVVDEKKIRIR